MKNHYLLLIFFMTSFLVTAQNNAFITTWEVGVNTPGLDITIPTTGTGYNYTVDFGDGTVLNNQTGDTSHTYASPGTYTVSITGDFPRIYFDGSTVVMARKIESVEQWGAIQWQSMAGAFSFCRYLSINAIDTPDLSQVTDMSEMFKNAYGFNSNINNWDVSNVTDMSKMFASTTTLGMHFNQPLNNWNVANVTDMNSMFAKNAYFNQALDNWNVSNVTNMERIFYFNTNFNQSLSNWDVSNVTNFKKMFHLSDSFNQPLDNWDVSTVTDMSSMFNGAGDFNQDLNSWNVSNVTDMGFMFSGASNFNHPLDNWNVSNVQNFGSMFASADAFNQDLSTWDVSSATTMVRMFDLTISFNQPINSWDVSNVTNMSNMFRGANNFNQPLNTWNVFNVTNMDGMFEGASSFNQNLSTWNFNNNIDHLYETFSSSGLDIQHYDAVLQRFVQLGITNKVLGAHALFYCDEVSHDELTNNLGWTVMGDSLHNDCEMALDNIEAVQWNIYPNPTLAELYIDSDFPWQEVTIYNVQGQALLSSKLTTSQNKKNVLNVSSLSAGVYFIQISGNGVKDICQIVKQ